MSIQLSIYILKTNQSIQPPINLLCYLTLYPHHLSIIYLPIYPLSTHQSIPVNREKTLAIFYLSTHLAIYLFTYLPIYLLIYPSTYPSVHPNIKTIVIPHNNPHIHPLPFAYDCARQRPFETGPSGRFENTWKMTTLCAYINRRPVSVLRNRRTNYSSEWGILVLLNDLVPEYHAQIYSHWYAEHFKD